MPIRQFLNGERCDPETTRVLGVAFEMVCIASKIIDLAKAGQRNPDILCEQALKDIRRAEVTRD